MNAKSDVGQKNINTVAKVQNDFVGIWAHIMYETYCIFYFSILRLWYQRTRYCIDVLSLADVYIINHLFAL